MNHPTNAKETRMPTFLLRALIALQAFAGLLIVLLAGPALAQAWPTARPITLVVAYAPGGGADAVARLITVELGKKLGQSIVIDNRPGAGGNIGTASVARAAPDGYTLLLTPPGPIINSKLLYKSLPYDPERDLAPVMKLVESPFAVLVRPDFPAKNLTELIAYARAHPGKLNVGTVGVGSTGHLLNLMVEHHTKTQFNIVPYKGSGQVVTDLLAGRLDMTIDYPSTYFGHIAQNKVRPIGTLGTTRSELLPGVQTFAEAGTPEIEATGWFGLVAPRGTPDAVVQRLQQEIAEILRTPEVRDKLLPLGYTPAATTPEQLRQLAASEMARIGAIVRSANLSLE